MSVSFSLGFILVVLFILNSVVTHLFNWWCRNVNEYNDEPSAFIVTYLVYVISSIFLLLYIANS